MKKVLILIILSVLLLAPSIKVEAKAKTLADMRNELNSLKAKKSTNNSNKTLTKNQINTAKNNILNKQNEIETNQQTIIDATAESERLDKEIADGKTTLEELIRTYQSSKNDNIYLEYLFKATSYEDLIVRYTVMEQLMNYQEDQITEWEEKIQYNNDLKESLKQKEIDLNKQIDSLTTDIDKLGDRLDELDDMTQDIEAEIKSVQDSIKFYESLGCKENEDLDSCLSVSGDKVFLRPLTKGKVTSEYGYRTHPVTGKAQSFHSGTDIGGNAEGTPVYAIANGTVAKITKKSSCGGNMVYIHHVVNGKKYTSTYMHLLKFNVTLGQKVTSNTIIGYVGGGSTSTRKGGYDTCTTGAHLHLSLATGWYEKDYFSYSNWRSHLVNPRKVLNIPSSFTGRS